MGPWPPRPQDVFSCAKLYVYFQVVLNTTCMSLRHLQEQYWVRTHHTHRLRLFHPVHRNQPVQANQLHSKRITVKFEIGGTGQPERLFDHWDRDGQERGTGDGKRWCGYAFFEMKDTKKDTNKMDREKMDHRDEAHEEPGRSSGSQVVNVYMDGGASRVEVHRPFNCENRLDRESVYLKSHGKGNDPSSRTRDDPTWVRSRTCDSKGKGCYGTGYYIGYYVVRGI